MSQESIRNSAAFIWSIAELLRGDFNQSEYGRIVLPFTVLRRVDCLLEPTKQAVLDLVAVTARARSAAVATSNVVDCEYCGIQTMGPWTRPGGS